MRVKWIQNTYWMIQNLARKSSGSDKSLGSPVACCVGAFGIVRTFLLLQDIVWRMVGHTASRKPHTCRSYETHSKKVKKVIIIIIIIKHTCVPDINRATYLLVTYIKNGLDSTHGGPLRLCLGGGGGRLCFGGSCSVGGASIAVRLISRLGLLWHDKNGGFFSSVSLVNEINGWLFGKPPNRGYKEHVKCTGSLYSVIVGGAGGAAFGRGGGSTFLLGGGGGVAGGGGEGSGSTNCSSEKSSSGSSGSCKCARLCSFRQFVITRQIHQRIYLFVVIHVIKQNYSYRGGHFRWWSFSFCGGRLLFLLLHFFHLLHWQWFFNCWGRTQEMFKQPLELIQQYQYRATLPHTVYLHMRSKQRNTKNLLLILNSCEHIWLLYRLYT